MKLHRDVKIVMGIGIFGFVILTAYWIIWFIAPRLMQSRTPDAADYTIYAAFEQALPLADFYVAITALIGVIGLFKMRPWGFLSMLLGSGGLIFLGLIDLLYDLEHKMFIPLNAESTMELVIVILTFILGPIIVILLWKHRKEFIK